MIRLDEAYFEKILKESLRCLHCNKEQKNMPSLKADLAAHYKKSLEKCPKHEQIDVEQDSKATAKKAEEKKENRKRKTPDDDDDAEKGPSSELLSKKQALSSH